MTVFFADIMGELLLGMLVVSCLFLYHEVMAAYQRYRATRSAKRR